MPISKSDIVMRDLLLGFVRLHVLYHAARQPVFGLELIRELARHGYTLGPGTLYPLLHRLERDGLLSSRRRVEGGRPRRYYTATRAGRRVLSGCSTKVRELGAEIAGYRGRA